MYVNAHKEQSSVTEDGEEEWRVRPSSKKRLRQRHRGRCLDKEVI